MQRRVTILDSTLRDGAQGEGISFSVEDKLGIVRALDELGVTYLEAGNPASNPKELEFFERAARLPLQHATLVAFGSTCRKGSVPAEDANCQALLCANTGVVSIFGKCWDLHVREILKTTREENLRMVEETCRFFCSRGKKVIFDAEHFFDGYRANRSFALEVLYAAVRGGAGNVTLCDTNGGALPETIRAVTQAVCAALPGVEVGIHVHDDCGMAVANTICAVEGGAAHAQGTFLGFGERTGNANLSAVIPTLQLKCGVACIPEENLHLLTATAMRIAEIANVTLHKNMPFVGRSAFAHKAGMHADGVLKNERSFEHIDPALVGNHRRFLMSEMTGKSAVLRRVQKLYPGITRDSPVLAEIVGELKEKEHQGYQYEGADSSFELIIRKRVAGVEPFFDLISYKVLDELPYDNNHSATATIKIRVGGKVKIAASDGDGPVNALDKALREALAEFYPCLNEVHLIDYKVRVMEPKDATAARVRVLITSADGSDIWTTVGVSQDIIEASWIALVDSIEHKLCAQRDQATRQMNCGKTKMD